MAEPRFASDDDLPRTLRRARDERERELREAAGQDAAREHDRAAHGSFYSVPSTEGTVSRLDIPFTHLVVFFIKAVFAAIPALIILSVLLWLGGKGLSVLLPNLSKMQILIHFPR